MLNAFDLCLTPGYITTTMKYCLILFIFMFTYTSETLVNFVCTTGQNVNFIIKFLSCVGAFKISFIGRSYLKLS